MKDNKKFYVLTKQGTHEYDIIVKETETDRTFELYYSMNGDWTSPGELLMKIKEQNEDSSIDLPSKLGRNIQCDIAAELTILLKFVSLYGHEKLMDQLMYNVVSVEDGFTI